MVAVRLPGGADHAARRGRAGRRGSTPAVLHAGLRRAVGAAPALAALVKDGRLGRKAGRGFYRTQGARRAASIRRCIRLLGVQPNGGIPTSEIVQRLTYAMLNEAARAAGEGVVRVPRDGDIGGDLRVRVPAVPRRAAAPRSTTWARPASYATWSAWPSVYGPRFAPCEASSSRRAPRQRFYLPRIMLRAGLLWLSEQPRISRFVRANRLAGRFAVALRGRRNDRQRSWPRCATSTPAQSRRPSTCWANR